MIINIRKVNNENDYVINTEDKCNIFVGNNGCGKSTVMNIVFYLLGNDMRLLNYCFDKIEISNDSPKIFQNIKYLDLLPSIYEYNKLHKQGKLIYLEVKNKKEEDYISENWYKKECVNKYSHSIFDEKDAFSNFISYLTEYKNYNIEYYKKLFMQTNKYLYSLNTPGNQPLIIKDNSLFKNYLLFLPPSIKFSLLSICKNNQQLTYFLEQFLYSYYVIWESYINKSILYHNFEGYIPKCVSMTQYNIVVTNEKMPSFVKEQREKEKLKTSSFKEQLDEYKKFLLNINTTGDDWIGSLHLNPREVQSQINLQQVINKLLDDNHQLEKALFQEYISFIKEYQYDENYKHEYDENIMLIYEYYIDPYLGSSFLDCSSTNSFFDMHKYDMIYELVNRFKDRIINHVNESLKEINDLLKEYFQDKTIFLTPNGIVISKSGKFSDDIKFEQLSIGEKRIIALIINCFSYEDHLFLIDEPESSLSVVLQKRLLPDLLKSDNKFIVATQSPYIVDDYDELFDYITWVNIGDDSSE